MIRGKVPMPQAARTTAAYQYAIMKPVSSGPIPLAKLGRPRLHHILPRERLFAVLDERRHRQALWVCGPPGAGKTTLLASYLDARPLGGLWFQCDAGDRDVSTWFYYLGEAVARQVSHQPPLPLLTSEYLPELAAFGRRWFRQCFASLGQGLLVLDNYQEASNGTLDELLCNALADLPEGLSLVFISRSEPPNAFARALAHGEMSVLGFDELRFTLEEAGTVAAAKGLVATQSIKALLSSCEGWAAGLTLMLERALPDATSLTPLMPDSRETLFAYFAAQVFDTLPAVARRELALCSHLPRVSAAQAAALTGNPAAADLLEQLHRRHLFTHRRQTHEAVYEFHALFRAFLRTQTLSLLSDAEREDALRDAARMLMELEQPTEALALYGEAGDWNAVTGIIAERAATLLAQGRGQTLQDWLATLPEERLARDPWMQYWQGATLISRDQQRARALLTRVHEHFLQADDFAGQVAAASGVLETYFFSYSGYAGLAGWTARIADLLTQRGRFTSPEQRLQACSTYLLACFFGDGAHPDVAVYVAEMQQLIRAPRAPQLRLQAGTFVISYAGAILHPALVEADLEMLDGLADDPALAPLRRAQWHQRYAYLCYLRGEYESAETRLRKAMELCEEHALRAPVSLINQILVFVLLAKGDIQGAAAVLDRWEQLLTAERPVERSQWNIARLVVWSAQEKHRDQWVRLAHEVAAQMDATGQTWIRVSHRLPGAYALIECGEYDSAQAWVRDLRTLMAQTCFVRFDRDVLLVEAALALWRGQTDAAVGPLGEALRLTVSEKVSLQAAQNRRVLSALLGFASTQAALRDAAHTVAARYGLDMEVPASARAPELSVRTLGGFQLHRDGGSNVPSGRTQHRPLEVLKFLAAQGGRRVSLSAVQEALWPDAEGDRAANALKVAIHRLRGLLHRGAIVVTGGSVILDAGLCQSDVQVFVTHAERAERQRAAGNGVAFEEAARAALALYRGPFLPEAEAVPWVLAVRERLSRRAMQLSLALGTHYETLHKVEEAIGAYESALALDALAEQVYQRLIQLHLRCGQPAQAVQVFRRCEQMLRTGLDMAPSDQTRALFRSAQGGTAQRAEP